MSDLHDLAIPAALAAAAPPMDADCPDALEAPESPLTWTDLIEIAAAQDPSSTPAQSASLAALGERLRYELERELPDLPAGSWTWLAASAAYQIGYLIRDGRSLDLPGLGRFEPGGAFVPCNAIAEGATC